MDKNPAEWTSEDIQAVLTRSAWVKSVNPELSSASLRSSARNKKRVAAAEGLRDKRSLTGFRVLVRWESALPVRTARRATSVPEEAADHYLLSISRMPVPLIAALVGGARNPNAAPDLELIAQRIRQASVLQREGKQPIAADRADWQESDFESRLTVSFPQGAHPIDASDRVVTFMTLMGALVVQASFSLKEMVYRGKMEI